MTLLELSSTPVFPRALVIGALGGTGLVLTIVHSRRGPLIYPVYAALLTALTLLLARYPGLPYLVRFAAALTGFVVASTMAYLAVGVLSRRRREQLRRKGRLPATVGGVSLLGHVWRIGFVVAVGAVLSACIAFIAV